ncbi:MAG: alkaline phosphatase [Marinilabiliaceae bacterium]|nr:alkaline phosphatase [Marinilabiliaceae bacterium]
MKKLRKINAAIIAASMFIGLAWLTTSCEETETIEKEVIQEVEIRDTITLNPLINFKTPKYVFFFIGDGMSAAQINLAEAALGSSEFKLKSASVGLGELNIRQLPVSGMQTTHAQDRYITGSAASATALACGEKTTINTISMNGDHSADLKTMAEMAKEKGMKVGIVSSVSIDHATPACFYAHTATRKNLQEIGQDLINSGFDYFAGGNVCHNKYKDYSLDSFINDAKLRGYSYVNTQSAFAALNSNSGKVIATLECLRNYVADGCALPYELDINDQTSDNDKITLAEFTKKGIEVLDNDNGFFIMVEGGKIDWACHANDAVATAHDMIGFDNAIGEALAFYEKHPDETLIVVTGDHECGGLSLGFSSTGYETAFDLLQYQNKSYWLFEENLKAKIKDSLVTTFEQALEEVKLNFGLGDESLNSVLALSEYELELLRDSYNRTINGESDHQPEEISVIYGYYDPFTVTVTHILNNKAGIDWTSYSHTGSPIPVFAKGQGELNFSGYYDNTDVAKKIMAIAGLK